MDPSCIAYLNNYDSLSLEFLSGVVTTFFDTLNVVYPRKTP